MCGWAAHDPMARRTKSDLAGPDDVRADGLLELKDQAGPDRLDDGGCAALLAVRWVRQVAVLDLVDVGDGSAAHHDRHWVSEKLSSGGKHSRSSRAADELVGRKEDSVEVTERVVGWVHVDLDVRRRGRKIPEGQCTVLVQNARNGSGVGEDARDVRGG